VVVDKAEIRELMSGLRGPSPETSSAVVEGLFGWMSGRLPGTVAAYLAMRDEVDVASLFGRLPGWRWVLPRVEPDGSLTLRDRDVPRERHRWGMEQPADAGPKVPVFELDVILAPGLAFDATGARLGRGGGFYDGLLTGRRTDCLVIGVTWSARVLDAVPMDEHDRRVDMLALETGVRACSSSS
jgi:5-formyltetrahydrofolate cyclo-ligase